MSGDQVNVRATYAIERARHSTCFPRRGVARSTLVRCASSPSGIPLWRMPSLWTVKNGSTILRADREGSALIYVNGLVLRGNAKSATSAIAGYRRHCLSSQPIDDNARYERLINLVCYRPEADILRDAARPLTGARGICRIWP